MVENVMGARRPPWLSPADLVREGVARTVAAGPVFWGIWAVYGIVAAAAQLGARAAGLAVLTQPLASASIAYQLLLILSGTLAAVLGLRLLLRGSEGWWRLDRTALYAAGLLVVGQVSLTAVSMLLTGSMIGGQFAIGRYLVGLVLYIAGIYALGKLALWPVGIIAGRADMTPARAWRMMRRTLRSLVLSMILLGLPVAAISIYGAVVLRMNPQAQPTAMVLALTLAATLMSLVNQGVIVSIYDRRGGRPETLGDVFE
ncbi:MAG: hypothetical protein JF588_20155 [Caulobacterales bacterium]|nr:hypothetical protein [Caulobacterales bacterium]